MGVFDGLAGAFTGAFGQTVTITPNGGASRDIIAIFRDKSEEDDLGGYGAMIREVYISAASEDVADITEGDAVVVDGVSYTTQAPMRDGRAMTKINLIAV